MTLDLDPQGDATMALMEQVVKAGANLYKVERTLRSQRQVLDWGPWTWLAPLSDADLALFVQETQQVLARALQEADASGIAQHLWEWQATAEAASDETFRDVRQSGFVESEFVEVRRPES
ncbi:MAG: hypothetical protein KGJ86_07695 [Chloroflexota bacterium]|nr:hypothetical protein [Chloroflexota bacterium]